MPTTYKTFRPSSFDRHIYVEDREDWLVLPIGNNRDADALARSNWRVVIAALGGESETLDILRFGHWACGWFEIALVHPSRIAEVEDWERALADYPIASDEDWSEEENREAESIWKACYDQEERCQFVRANREDFGFYDMADIIACLRGETFPAPAGLLVH